MKKYLFPVITSLVIGIFLAYFLIKSYDNIENISVSKNAETIYYVEKGIYSNKENMLESMNDFEYYIYNVDNNMYYTYIGISTNKKNAEKIQGYYKQKGYDTNIREKITDNVGFITILRQYDELLSATKDGNAISTICNQVLAKYEELVNNEY